jgi:hypothetical protein
MNYETDWFCSYRTATTSICVDLFAVLFPVVVVKRMVKLE